MSTDDSSDTGSRPAPETEPRVVGPYRLEKVLGRGGMGKVHLAYDQRLDRRVAIKHIHREASRTGTGRERLRREAKAVARLSHPAIVQIFDILEEDDGDWIVMELVDGPTVADLLADGPTPVDRTISIARQVAEGLAEAHSKDILHRDLKTENVMVAPGGRAKILDFGLAKVLGPSDSDKSLTVVGEVMGTCRSMSPEQAKGLELDPRSDLFSLGTLIYEMLSGDSPFQGPTAVATMTRVCTVELPSLDTINAAVPKELADLVSRLLAKERDGRPPDAPTVAAELGQLAEVYGNSQESESTWPRVSRGWWIQSDADTATMAPASSRVPVDPRRRGLLAAAAIALSILVGAVAWLWLRPDPVDETVLGPTVRRSVAILGYANHQSRDDLGWVSTALSEMIGAELARTEEIRLIAGESVAEAVADLGTDDSAPNTETVERLQDRLGADIVVEGSFFTDAPPSQALSLVTRVYQADLSSPTSLKHDGSHTRILDLASAVGNDLRQRLEVVAPSTAAAAAAGRPTTIDGQRHYYRGLDLLRDHDLIDARQAFELAIDAEPDMALAHAALAEVLSALGYDDLARSEAAEAVALAGSLGREDRLFVEARHSEMSQRWDEAIETYRRLVRFAPDDPRYGLRLAQALIKASLATEAVAEVQRLRSLGPPISEDPRLDLMEAEASCATADWEACDRLARQAAERGERDGARLQAARAHLLLSQHALRGGDDDATRRADAEAEAARRLFRDAGDGSGEAEALNQLAAIAYRRGDTAAAQEGFQAALAKFQEVGNRRETAVALNNVAVCQLDLGNTHTSSETRRQAWAEAERSGSAYARVLVGLNLAEHDRHQGRLDAARRGAESAIREAEAANILYLGHAAEVTLGRIVLALGEVDTARDHFANISRRARELGDREMEAHALEGLARAALIAGDTSRARQVATASLELRQAIDDAKVLSSRGLLALVELAEDRPRPAREWLAEPLATSADERLASSYEVRAILAHALALLGDAEGARAARDRARALEAECPDLEIRLLGRSQLARADALLGDEDAQRRLLFVIQEAAGHDLVIAELTARLALAEILDATGDTSAATEQAAQLRERAAALGLQGFIERSARMADEATVP